MKELKCMEISIKYIKENRKEFTEFYTKNFSKHFSPYLTFISIKLGITPNTLTYIMWLIGILAAFTFLNENIITFLNEANAVLNRAKDLGRLEIYFVWKKKIKEYKNNTDKVFEIMNNTSTEKLSYSLISTISLSIITFSFFIILVLILSIRKNV